MRHALACGIVLCALCLVNIGLAQNNNQSKDQSKTQAVPLAALGDLELAFAPVQATDRVPGAALRGVVGARSGEAYRVLLPRIAHRAVFQLSPGEQVQSGDPVVRLEGPEIHHWKLEFDAVEARYETARRRYVESRALHADGALPAERWTAIQDRYFELSLEYEHMQHFRDLLIEPATDDDETLLVGSPAAGVVSFDSRSSSHAEGAELFSVISADALRLQVETPADRAGDLLTLNVEDCSLALASVDRSARNFFVAAWSEALDGDCSWPLGTILSVQPHYAQEALVVPRSALFQWQREPHVFVHAGDRLLATPVTLLADTENGYAVAVDTALAGAELLTASVSAVQGILLGLGSE